MTTTRNKCIASILLITLLFSFSQQLSAQESKRKVTEKLISKLNLSEMVNRMYLVSNDVNHIAFRLNSEGKQIAVIDGVKGKPFDAVNPPAFSQDGKRFAYAAKSGNKWLIVIDHKVEASIDSVAGIKTIQFSRDDKSYVYIANTGRKQYLVINGIKGKLYDDINENSITFGLENNTVAYAARRGKFQLIVMEGKEGYSYDEVGIPIISGGGKHFAYWAKKDHQSFAVLDNQASKPYQLVNAIVFSPDGKHCTYDAVVEGKHMIVTDGIESEKYEYAHSLKYSDDGLQLVYGMEMATGDQEGFKQYVVVNGVKTGPYETVVEGSLAFSSDSKHFVYKVERHDEFFFVRDGKEGTHYQDALQVTAVFSPDNNHFAYAAEMDSKRMIVVDEKESSKYNDVMLICFSPDNKHVVSAVRIGDKENVVVDGVNGESYDSVMGQGNIVFDSPNSFHYLGLKGGEIFLVQEVLE